MAILNLHCNAYYMVSAYKGRYIYCLGKTIYVHDAKTGRKTEVLSGLGNAYIAVSRNDKYLGCTHPKKNKFEVVLFKIGEEGHEKLFSVDIKEERGTFEQPIFTYDEKYILVSSGFPAVSLWAINVCTAEKKLIMKTDAHSFIRNVICNEYGIIVVLHEHINPAVDRPTGRILHFSGIDSQPNVITFDKNACERLRKELHATYLESGAVELNSKQLLVYYRYSGITPESRLQVIDYLQENNITPLPQATIPCSFVLRPVISSDGQYMAIVGHNAQHGDEMVLVYRTSDWNLIYTHKEEHVWNVSFIPQTDMLLVCCNRACVLSIGELSKELTK